MRAMVPTSNGSGRTLTLFANDIQPITVVMLLDRSGSMRAQLRAGRAGGRGVRRAMLPADKARIGSFCDRIQIDPREFTSNHEELVESSRTSCSPEGPTPLWNAVNVGITALLHQHGRRVVLVFTDGVDMPMNFSNNNSSLKDVMKRAEEEDVMVYAIGLAGRERTGGARRLRRHGPGRHGAGRQGAQAVGGGGMGVAGWRPGGRGAVAWRRSSAWTMVRTSGLANAGSRNRRRILSNT